MNSISNKAAIVGVGVSGFSKDSGRTELRMTCECIKAALDDAGLVPLDIDGIVKHTDDASDEHSVTSSMGMGNLTYFGESRWDSAPCSMVLRAAIGVATGVANYVVLYRAVNGSSRRRMMPSMRASGQMSTSDLLQWTYHAPFGLMSEAGGLRLGGEGEPSARPADKELDAACGPQNPSDENENGPQRPPIAV